MMAAAVGSQRERYNIEDIHGRLGPMGDWMARRFGVIVGQRSGANTRVECPNHRPGHTDSGSVLQGADGRERFTCWRCPIDSVDALDLLVTLGEAHDLADAIDQLGREVGATSSEWQPDLRPRPTRPRPQPRTLEVLDPEADVIDDSGGWVDQFAGERAWSSRTLTGLGVRLVVRSVRTEKGHRKRCQRLRFPFVDADGNIVSYQDRKLEPSDPGPKWLTGPGCPVVPFNLVAYDAADSWADSGEPGLLVVVEGVSDAITLLDKFGLDFPVVGLPGASTLGGPGSSVTGEAGRFAAATDGLVVLVFGDNDVAGQSFRQRVSEVHRGPLSNLTVPAPHKDLNEWTVAAGIDWADQWVAALEQGVDL